MNRFRATLGLSGSVGVFVLGLSFPSVVASTLLADGPAQNLAAASRSIEVDTPRPLSAAIRELSARHGWVITYEDPRWSHESDVDDVTDRYPEAARKIATGELPNRLLRPRAKHLEISYRMPEVAIWRGGVPLVVSRLVGEASEGFEVLESGGILHVIPTESLDAEGRLVPHVSPFDLPIRLPKEPRTIRDTIRTILVAVNQVSGTTVSFGLVMIDPFDRHTVEIGSEDRSARELLSEAMRLDDLETSWLMHYDPGLQKYFFSVYPVHAPTMPAEH